MKWLAYILSICYLLFLLGVWGFVAFDNGSRWLTTLFLFSPRWAIALPLALLVPLCLFKSRRSLWISLLSACIVVFPLCGWRVPFRGASAADTSREIRLLTCNLGEGASDIDGLVALALRHEADVIALQECPWAISTPLFEKLGWQFEQRGNIAIGSRFSLGEPKIIARQPESHYNAVAAIACELGVPTAPSTGAGPGPSELVSTDDAAIDPHKIEVISVHLPTFRPALEKIRGFDFSAGEEITALGAQYRSIASSIREYADQLESPTLLAGDFNVPIESHYYKEQWNRYQNAFSAVGLGFGFSKYTRLHGIRIDHVLADEQWKIASTEVEQGLGGDHRPVVARLSLVKSN